MRHKGFSHVGLSTLDLDRTREEISRIAGTVLEEVKRANTVGVEVTREELFQLLEAGY